MVTVKFTENGMLGANFANPASANLVRQILLFTIDFAS